MQNLVNIYIKYQDDEILYSTIDKNLNIENIFQSICAKHNIENLTDYALLWHEDDRKNYSNQSEIFITNETKENIIEGQTLLLSNSPRKICQDLEKEAPDSVGEYLETLKNLKEFIQDQTFLKEFHRQSCFKTLIDHYIETTDYRIHAQILDILMQAIDPEYIHEVDISDDFLEHLFLSINSTNTDSILVGEIIRLLKEFLTIFPQLYSDILDGIQLPTLVQSLMCDELKTHISIISFINKVFELTPIEHQKNLSYVILEVNEMRIIVYKYVLKKTKNISDDLTAELVLLQKMLLYEEIQLYATKSTRENINISKLNEELQKYDPIDSINVIAKQFGFINFKDPIKDFLTQDNNLLVFNCVIYYLSQNPGSAYYISGRPSIFELIKLATNTIANMIKNFNKKTYKISLLPILFEVPFSFQELVCVLINNHRKIKSTLQNKDSLQITRYFEEKIKRSLFKLQSNYTRLNCDLDRLDFDLISALMTKESIKWNEKLHNLAAVKNLREYFEPSVKSLVTAHIYNKIKLGIPIEILTLKPKKHASKEDTILRLLSTLDVFEYGCENMFTKIPISDILLVSVGEAAAAKIDEKLAKKVPVMNILLIECKNNDKHIFSTEAENHALVFDVLNFQAAKDIDESWQPSGYKTLLDCFIDASLMDMKESDFPTEAPKIPPPPENLDFAYTDIS